MAREVNLWVNDEVVAVGEFVQQFIDNIIAAIINTLKRTGEIDTLSLNIEGSKTALNLNGADVPMNAFVADIVRETVVGMVSSLKGVNNPGKITITINA